MMCCNHNHHSCSSLCSYLRTEYESLEKYVKEVGQIKVATILKLEELKSAIRRMSNPSKYFNSQRTQNGSNMSLAVTIPNVLQSKSKYPSVVLVDKLISTMDREISLIQNKHDMICNDFKTLEYEFRRRINKAVNAKLAMDMLSQRSEELHSDYKHTILKLEEMKAEFSSYSESRQNSSKVALHMLEIEKEILENQSQYKEQIKSTKKQYSDAARECKNALDIFALSLEFMKQNHDSLIILTETEKLNATDPQLNCILQKGLPLVEESRRRIMEIRRKKNAYINNTIFITGNMVEFFKKFCYILLIKYNCIEKYFETS